MTEIFNYEFKSGCYGLTTSEYTDEIIRSEVKRITKHRQEIDSSLVYVVIRNTSNYRLVKFESENAAINYLKTVFGDTYLYYNGCVFIPSIDDYEVKLNKISQI